MRRREFIAGLGGTAAVLPSASGAQTPGRPSIGLLSFAPLNERASTVAAFLEGLAAEGFTEGRNVTIERRAAGGDPGRLPELAAGLVRRRVSVIVATNDTAALAAKAQTTAIPIVFTVGNDPVERGLVSSMRRPGGNLTGTTNQNVELIPKRLELLRELLPRARVMAALVNPAAANADLVERYSNEAAHALGLQLHFLHARTEAEIATTISSLPGLQAGALLIGADSFFNGRSRQLGGLALRHRVPAIFQTRDFAAAGGMLSYFTEIEEMFSIAGIYVGRILKGANPAELPIHQASKVQLIVNLKTARALGIEVPTALLVRADEVIE